MNKKLLSLYGLKWNPFAPEVPVEAFHVGARLDSFCWRVEQLVGEGGFALVTGLSGLGKSVTLRVLAERLSGLRDVQVGVLSRPQAGLHDFYRELGELFGVQLQPHNRWGGAKALRSHWQAHIDASLCRPVLIIDEGQEMQLAVLNELRLLCSARLDSHLLLTVVLAGDQRLIERFRSEELLPLGSRMRVRLALERATPEELRELVQHAIAKAGAPKLMSAELIATLCDHAQGNLRALMNMAGELLACGRPARSRHRSTNNCSSRPSPRPRRPSSRSRHDGGERHHAARRTRLAPGATTRRAALARHRAVVRTGGGHRRRRTQVLQELPRPRSGRRGRFRNPLLAPLRGAASGSGIAVCRRGCPARRAPSTRGHLRRRRLCVSPTWICRSSPRRPCGSICPPIARLSIAPSPSFGHAC